MRLRLIALWVLLLPLTAWAQPLSSRVPGDALFYVGWQGTDQLQPAYQGSRLKAVIDNTTLPEFLDKKLPELIDRLGEGEPEAAAVFKQVLSATSVMCKYPTVLYIGSMEIAQGRPPMPRVALVCDAGPQAEALETQLRSLIEKAGPVPIPLTVKRQGGAVLAAIGELGASAEAMLLGQPAEGGLQPLAANKLFQSAVAQVQKDAALTVYINVPDILKLVDQAAAMNPEARENWPGIRSAMNLTAFQSVIFTAGFDGREWLQQGFIGLTGERAGLASLFDAPPLDDATFKLVPASAIWMAAGRLNFARLYSEILAGLEKASPQIRPQAEQAIAMVNQMLGFDLEKDFLAAFGDQWVVYSAPQVGGSSIFGLVVVNPVNNAQRLSASLDQLEQFANRFLTRQSHSGEPNFAIRRSQISGIDIHFVNFFLVNPAWAVHDGKFYLSFMPQAIPPAIEESASAKKSILDNPAFIQWRTRIGVVKPASIQFVDLPQTAPSSYPILSQILGLVEMFVGEDAPPSLVPPINKLLPQLSPAGGASWSDPAGWHMKAISPIPGSFLLSGPYLGASAAPATAMSIAILLPSLSRARELANRSVDAANLHSIAQACLLYAAKHDDRLPEHLAELVVGGQINPKQLVRPQGGTEPLTLTPRQLEESQNDWHAIEKAVDEHCDYVYLGKGTKANNDSLAVMALTKPWLSVSREGVNCAFYDSHVDWIRPNGLTQPLQLTNEARKQSGLPEIDIDKLISPLNAGR